MDKGTDYQDDNQEKPKNSENLGNVDKLTDNQDDNQEKPKNSENLGIVDKGTDNQDDNEDYEIEYLEIEYL